MRMPSPGYDIEVIDDASRTDDVVRSKEYRIGPFGVEIALTGIWTAAPW